MSLLERRTVALLATSIVARLPDAMLGLGLLVHVHRLTGSYAVAGLASGAYALARGAGAPLFGRIVDRCGQTMTLICTAGGSALLLGAIATLSPSAATAVALAAAIGLIAPPVDACARALLPAVVADPAALPKAYTVESTALELTFIFGPPLALGVGSLWSTGAALALAGVVQLLATVAFALQPASRNWRPPRERPTARGGSLRSPAMRTLILVLIALGAVFGAVDVAVTAAASALGHAGATGPLLGVWGVGSLLGGVVVTRWGGPPRRAREVTVLVAGLAASHAALLATGGSVVAMGAALLLAGAWIAPTTGVIYGLVGGAAPAGTATEAFSWVATAEAIGVSLGAAVAGAATESFGASGAFVLAGGAGALAVLIVAVRACTLEFESAVAGGLAPAVA